MKKNAKYMQTCVLNEVFKVFTTHQVAEAALQLINKDSQVVTIYETREDGFVLRTKHDSDITDSALIAAMIKGIRHLIENDADKNVQEIVSDTYDFDYDKSIIAEGYFSDNVIIRRSGRLISIEIDL